MMAEMISVLIADDNIEFGNLTSEYMAKQEDIKIVGIAHDGLQAVEMIKTSMPDVVILDIIMPNLDGIGVLERIASMQLKSRPIIIILSALNQDGIIQKTISLGADYYIVKPFDLGVLVSRIRQIYNEKSHMFSACDGIAGERFLLHNNRPIPSASSLEVNIARLLKILGISPHMTGYKYLREAVKLSLEESGKVKRSVTKVIYPAVAEKYGTSPQKVERAIRNAIECAWQRGNPHGLEILYGCQINFRRGRPTNSQFIAMVSDRLRIMGVKNEEQK